MGPGLFPGKGDVMFRKSISKSALSNCLLVLCFMAGMAILTASVPSTKSIPVSKVISFFTQCGVFAGVVLLACGIVEYAFCKIKKISDEKVMNQWSMMWEGCFLTIFFTGLKIIQPVFAGNGSLLKFVLAIAVGIGLITVMYKSAKILRRN